MVHTPAGARAHTRPRLTRVFVLQLSKGRARVISKYEMDKVLSERGSLILYLDKVTPPPPFNLAQVFFPPRFYLSLNFHPAAGFSPKARRNHLQDPPEAQSWRLTTSCCVRVRIL